MAQAGRSPHVRAAYRLTCGCAALGSRDGAAALVPSPAPAPGPASSPASRPRTSPTHPIPRSGLGPAPRPQPRPGPCPFPSAGLSPGALPAPPLSLGRCLRTRRGDRSACTGCRASAPAAAVCRRPTMSGKKMVTGGRKGQEAGHDLTGPTPFANGEPETQRGTGTSALGYPANFRQAWN